METMDVSPENGGPGIYDKLLPLLQQWATAGTGSHTQIWMQLNHPGKQSPKGLNRANYAPSAIPFRTGPHATSSSRVSSDRSRASYR